MKALFNNLFGKSVPFAAERKKNKIKRRPSPFTIILAVFFTIYTLSLLVLFFWAFSTSLKTEDGFLADSLWLTKEWKFINYVKVFQFFTVEVPGKGTVNMFGMFINTILYSGVNAFIAAIVPCVVAYVVARFPCVYSKILNYIVIVTMILPIVGAYPSEIYILKTLGLYDKMYGTWVQKFNFLGMYFLVFLATVNGLSKEYWEAAFIDGANQYTVLLRIILPLLKNTIMLVVLVQFIDMWNNYQAPLLYIPSYPTLAYGIYSLSNLNFNPEMANTPMRMAGCIIFATPILILFIIFKDKLMGDLTMGGVKE